MSVEGFRLSAQQRRNWSIFESDPPAAQAAILLEGPVDRRLLEAAIARLVDRHEILRTLFRRLPGRRFPVQSPEADEPAGLPCLDLRGVPENGRDEAAREIAECERALGCALQSGPILRRRLLELATERHLLLLTLPALCADAATLAQLVQELGRCYSACQRGSEVEGEPLQYADFADWQEQWLSGEDADEGLGHWRGLGLSELPWPHLPGAPTVGAASGSFVPRSLAVDVDDATRERLAGFEGEGTGAAGLLFAAWVATLWRLGSGEEILLGTVLEGRAYEELEAALGLFAHSVPIAWRHRRDETFARAAERAAAALEEATVWQEYFRWDLLGEQAPPFLPIAFEYRTLPLESGEAGPLKLTLLHGEAPVDRYQVKLLCRNAHGGPALELCYDAASLGREMVERLGESFRTLLADALARPGVPLEDLAAMGAGERRRLLGELCAGERAIVPELCLHELFEEQARRVPEAVALVCGGESLTYRELDRRGDLLASELRRRGIGPERVAGLYLDRSALPLAMLAVLKAGGAYVVLPPDAPPARLAFLARDARVLLTVTTRSRACELAGIDPPAVQTPLLILEELPEAPTLTIPKGPARRAKPDNLAYVSYTSGSTGEPKGVAAAHRGAVNFLGYLQSTYGLCEEDVVLQIAAPGFDAMVREIFGPWSVGGTVVTPVDEDARRPESLLEAIRGNGVTALLSLVPTLLRQLVAAIPPGSPFASRLRLVLLSGERLYRADWERASQAFGEPVLLVNQYGPTECTMTSSFHRLTTPGPGVTDLPLGRPIRNARFYLLDPRLELAPLGGVAELAISGPGVARGYVNRPDLTAASFLPDPFAEVPGSRLYRTGDLASWLPAGDLSFHGRRDRQVKVRGVRVEPAEIEAVLTSHAEVRQATVIASETMPGETRLTAYLVAREGGGTQDLRGFLATRIPEALIPGQLIWLPELPRTATGKVDLEALARLDPSEDRRPAPPRNPVEELLAGIWSEVLGTEEIGIEDDFYALGGHSLFATQVVSRIRGVFGIEMPLRTFLETPTVSGLAQRLDREIGHAVPLPPMEPAPRQGELPLSFAQQRFWFLDQMDPGNAAYNIEAAVRLHGRLDRAALASSLAEIVRRHEALRTIFPSVAGEPVQRILPPGEPGGAGALPLVDLAGLPAARRAGESERLAGEEASRPFDLAAGPLLRSVLIASGDEEHTVLLNMHHIVSDGWSRGVLLRELGALYQAFSSGLPSPLPELALQYADYAHWQRRWLSGDALEHEIAYWRTQLRGASAALELPTDRPRPAAQTFRGGNRPVHFPPALLAALQALSRREGTTLFMTLVAVFQTLLHRHTGQDDLAVGAPIAGRNRIETEDLIGLFVNSLVLRADLSGNPPFREFLRQVREVTLAAYSHQDLPFEKLVAELALQRDPSRTPLFQVMFVLQNAPLHPFELPGLTLEPIAVESGAVKFDLNVLLNETARGITGIAKYNRDLFDGATVARLIAHFEEIARGAVDDPASRIAELPLLTAAERVQILGEWNDSASLFSPDICLHELFERQERRTPEATAVVDRAGAMSYRELEGRANRLARQLVAWGVGPGTLVAVYLERSAEMIVALLGVLKAGGAYVPLDASYPEARIAWIVGQCGVRHAISQRSRSAILERVAAQSGLAEAILLDAPSTEEGEGSAPAGLRVIERPELEILPAGPVGPRAGADDLAYIIFTSGTTGTPKGVMVRHRPVINLIEWVNRTFSIGPADRLLLLASICFDLSVYDIFGILAAGGSVRVASDAEAQDPDSLVAALLNEPITFWDTAPAALAQLVPFLPPAPQGPRRNGEAGGDSHHLRLVFLSGDWIPVNLPDRVRDTFPRARVISLGGATEATVWSNFYPVAKVDPAWASIPYGRPIQNARYHVLSGAFEPAPIGVPGDLYIGGDCLFLGYGQEPRLTAEKLLPDPFATAPGQRLYRTGDRARYWKDGLLEFLGRADHQVKVRGFRIELGEIEAVLRLFPEVLTAVVIVREDDPGDRRLVAYIVPREEPPTAGELRAFIKDRLPAYMVPAAFVFLADLPVTPNGKLDRKALPAPASVRETTAPGYEPARSPIEETLARIWEQVLRREQVSIHDNFFELGGDSILSIQVVSRAAQAGIKLAPRQLFDQPTIAGLAAVAALGALETPGEGGADASPGTEVPLTPIQRWFFEQRLPCPGHFNQALLLEIVAPGGGRVDPALLAEALARLHVHHDVLRLRYLPTETGDLPFRQVYGSAGGAPPLARLDLAALPAGIRRGSLEAAAAALQASLDLTAGPLLRAALFDLGGERPERLLLILHHLAVDGVSWRVLLEDLETLYRQLAAGADAALPASISFGRWAEQLVERAAAPEVLSRRASWLERLDGAPAPLPADFPRGDSGTGGAGTVAAAETVAVSLEAGETRALLQEVPKAYRTQINDVLLTALLEAFSRWTGSRRLLVDLEGHGREELLADLDVSRTMGWFTTLFPVLLNLEGIREPGAALKSIKEQLRAVPDRGASYGILRYLAPEEVVDELRALPRPEVVFNYHGQLDLAVSGDRLFRLARESSGPPRAAVQPRSHLLEIGGGVSDGRLHLRVSYSAEHHRRATIERLLQSFLASLRSLISHCLSCEAGAPTPSDFPLAQLDQAALDRLAAGQGAWEDLYPATPVQQGMVFHTLAAPASGVYVGQMSLELGAGLDAAAFETAWRQLVQRHAILRTGFLWRDLPRPLQLVRGEVEIAWERGDWSALSAEERQRELAAYLDADRRRGFDFAAPPLLRFALFRLGDQGHRFVWSFHFALLDGWSMQILLRELFALYDDASHGRAIRLDPPRPYRDYIAWLEAQELARAEAFWRRTLAGLTAPAPLASERPGRPAGQGAAEVSLPEAATAALRTLTRQLQVTFNTLVQGAWSLLLSRHSGATDLVFGAVSSGRSAPVPGIESIVGLFINTLPVRVRIPEAATAAEWLRGLQEEQAEVRQFEHSPLAQIQGWSGLPRDRPLFESIVIFENYPVDNSVRQQAGLALGVGEAEVREQTNYPLTAFVTPGERLHVRLLYDAGRFTAVDAGRLLGHLTVLLAGLGEGEDLPLALLPVLTPAERHQLLREWNDTAGATPGPLLLHEWVAAQARRTPEAVAVAAEGGTLTYRELVSRASRLAGALHRMGVGPDRTVPIAAERSLEMVIGLLGILAAGGAYLPFDPSYPEERLAFMLATARTAGCPPVLLTTEPLRERFAAMAGPDLRILGIAATAAAGEDEVWAGGRDLDPDNLAYAIFTSGSTGRPKGAMNTHRAICNRIAWMQQAYELTPADSVLQKTPFSFDVSVWEFFWPLATGARLVLARPEGHRDSAYLTDLIASQGITTLHFVPSMLRAFLADPGVERCTTLRRVIASGEALPRDLVQRFFASLGASGAGLHNLYGPTEAAVDVTFHRCAPEADDPGVPLGRPISNLAIHILDPGSREVPPGVTGELAIGGVGLARGYLGRADLTAERFVPDSLGEVPGARLYRTGDLARYRPDGEIEFLGRIDHQVKIRGVRIELGEIEAVLSEHPGVEEVTVVVHTGAGPADGDPLLLAYVVSPQGSEPAESELRELVQRRLPEAMRPARYIALPELPQTPSGKVDRRALAMRDPGLPQTGAFVAPATPVEEIVAGIFAEVLHTDHVGPQTSFFDLGGHSLLATQLISRAARIFGVELPLGAVFEAPRVRELAARIEELLSRGDKGGTPPLEREPRGEPLALSFAQQRLWFLDQLEPGSAMYNLPVAVRLEGALDVPAFAAAWSEIVRRHETLRTTFTTVADEPRQTIDPPAALPLPTVDLGALAAEARHREALRLAQEEARRPFDLGRGPLLRVALLRESSTEHVVVVNMHHIVSDAWSQWVMVMELRVLYEAYCQRRPSPLPELAFQYADFAGWQRRWLSGEVLEAEIAYWRERLAGAPPALELPTDRPRSGVQTYQGSRAPVELGEELSGALRALSRAAGATVYMTLAAGFLTLLGRLARRQDLCLGTPIAGRRLLDTEKMIGFFVNNLVLRADLGGDPSFREVLGRTREIALGAYAHQDLPFEKLVEELQPERDLALSPVFQVTFTFQNAPAAELESPGLTFRPLDFESGTTRVDLLLMLFDRPARLDGHLQYSSDLFDPATALRIGRQLRSLLVAAAQDPERRIADLPLLSAAERHQMLREWNDSELEAPFVPLHERIAGRARRSPWTVAVEMGGEVLTYGELDARANRLARYLQELGVGRDVPVGICCDRSPGMVVALLGVLKAGGAYVPLDPAYPAERLAFMVEDSGLLVLLTQEHLVESLPSFWGFTVRIDADWDLIAGHSETVPAVDVLPGNLANLIYTSGSTGRAKGVMVNHGGLANQCAELAAHLSLTPRDRVLQFASLSFDVATWEIAMALSAGATLCVDTREALLPGPGLVRLLKERRITTFALIASTLAVLPQEELPDLSTLIVGGEVCPIDLARRWGHGRRLINSYGPTEAAISASTAAFQAESGRLPIGRPVANMQSFILDDALQPLPSGVGGGLYLAGAGLARGYLGHTDLTADSFLPHPWSLEPGARLYRTGDLVRALPGGEIEFLGRVDQQVKVRGFRIELGEIEAALAACAGVREAVVGIRDDLPGGRGLVAYLAVEPEAGVTSGTLREALRQKLPGYMVPAHFAWLAALPLLPNGKVDRAALAQTDLPLATEGDTAGVTAPRTPTERLLAGIFSEVLEMDSIGIESNFFELGGHSLLATRLVSRLRAALGAELPVSMVFDAPTVGGLASTVDRALAGAPPAARRPPLRRRGDGASALSYAQQRLWFLDQLQPGSPAYNIPAAVRLLGPLDEAALAASLGEVVRRHEALRTVFRAVDGEPVQVILPAGQAPSKLPVIDLRSLPAPLARSAAQSLVRAEARRPFDLAVGPLLRATLLRLGAEESIALLTLHHIVSDGWSNRVLLDELGALYRAAVQELPSPLAELPFQYADFALWQRSWLTGEILEKEIAFFREQLGDLPASLELPTDRPRPGTRAGRGARRRWALSAGLSRALEALCGRCGATPFMGLTATLQVLLHRQTGQHRISVGTPVSGRDPVETEALIGFFVNTLVLAADLSGDPPFLTALERVRESTLAAFAHQELPFEKLVEELRPERDPSRTPLFQVMLVLNPPVPVPEFPGLVLEPLAADSGTAKFDLTLTLNETDHGLAGNVEYDLDLFDPATVDRLLLGFEALLRGLVESPQTRLSELSVLDEATRHQLLVEWNGGDRRRPATACLHHLFALRAASTPAAVAVVAEGRSLTYAELDARAGHLACRLRAMGVGPEVPVAVCVERSFATVVAILGILKAGGAYLPLDPAYPSERLMLVLDDALGGLASPVLVTSPALVDRFTPQEGTPAVLGRLSSLMLDEEGWAAGSEPLSDLTPGLEPRAGNLAYIIYTSGSTGRPKGVSITHGNAVRLFAATDDWFHFGSDDVWTLFHSYAFDFSVWEIWGALLYGGRLVVVPYWVSRSPAAFLDLLARERVTVLNQTPSAFGQLVAAEAGSRSDLALRWIVFGGEALDLTVLKPWFSRHGDRVPRLVNMYGITETTVHVTYRPLSTGELAESRRSPIGEAIPDLRVVLLDGGLSPVPPGSVGEIFVGGEGLARGYLGRSELTAERFLPDPFSAQPGARLYRSGDLARYRPDGGLDFLGRADRQVKVRGFRIEPGEIETVLERHPELRAAAVVPRAEANGESRLVAFVIGAGAQAPAPGELRAWAKERLPDYMVPSFFAALPELPRLPNGKVDRGTLARLAGQLGSRTREGSWTEPAGAAPLPQRPENQVEELLAELYRDILGIERVEPDDNFFDLGGHSLLATRLVSRVREAFGRELDLRALFETPTIAGLAATLGSIPGGERAPAIAPVPRSGPLPASFGQRRLWFLDQLEPGRGGYNLPSALRITGDLEIAALRAALQEIVHRHEALRTTFDVTAAGEPVQVIALPAPLPLPVVDLAALPAAAANEEAQRLAGDEAVRPFDLSRGPLFRGSLLALGSPRGEVEHRLLATLHHIVGDGWSLGVLVRELRLLYGAAHARLASSLAELPIQYADFAAWQRQSLTGETLEREVAYWRDRLADPPPPLDLPTDRPRPPLQTFAGASHSFRIPEEPARNLLALGRRRGATLFMTLLAGFEALLARYTGQDDFAVGTPIAGRTQLGTEDLIGFFVNTLVLRADLAGDPSFEELLARGREAALGAFTHQELPFEKLVEELRPARRMDRAPLFQVMLVLQNASLALSRPAGLADLALEPLTVEGRTAKFDLTLLLGEVGGSLVGALEYNTDLFDAATAGRMAGHFVALLAAVTAGPGRRVSEALILSATERSQLIAEWSDTGLRSQGPEAVHSAFAEWARRAPELPALLWNGSALTYGEADRQAGRLAARLVEAGVGPEVRVGLAVTPSPEAIVALLAILKAGGAYVPLDPTYPAERLALMFADAGLLLLLTQERFRTGLAGHGVPLWTLDEALFAPGPVAGSLPPSGVPESAAYVIYTSGSTGRPKGVVGLHGGLASFTRAMAATLDLKPGDRMLQFASLSFDASMVQIFPTLASGATLVLHPDPRGLSTRELLDLCASTGVTVLDLPAALWRQWVADVAGSRLAIEAPIRAYLTGGESVPSSVLRAWAARVPPGTSFLSSYGPTETTVTTTAFRTVSDQAAALGADVVPLGRPLPSTGVYLLDRWLEPVPQGVPGEICIGGAGVTRGYLHLPAATAERFLPDPFAVEPGSRLYRTGDLARRAPDGSLQFIGRRDWQVKVRGHRVELAEIETAFATLDGVHEALVTLWDEGGREAWLVAYVAPQPGAELAVEGLRTALSARLPEPFVPTDFVILPELPRLPTGKLDRKALPAPDRVREERETGLLPPRTPVELQLAEIFAALLGRDRIGIDEDFFALGGHSLLATQLVGRVRQSLSVELPLRAIFEARTVAGLAMLLGSESREDEMAPIIPLAVGSGEDFLDELERISGEEAKARLGREIPTGEPGDGWGELG